MKTKISAAKPFILDMLSIIIGNCFYGMGLNIFTAPNNIAPGGLAGVATIFHSFAGFPIGISIFVMNIPLFAFAIFKFRKIFVLKTFTAMFFLSFFCDFFAFLPSYKGDMITASIFGGVFMGVGLGIIYTRDIVTGGTDLLGKIVKLKFPHVSFGTMVLIIDFFVVIIAGIYYKDMQYTLYPLVTIFISTLIINKMIDGLDIARVAFIISKVPNEISKAVIEELDRSTTFLNGKGGYNNNQLEVLMCTVKPQQLPKLKKIVSKIDPRAFMFVNTASEVLGEGFKEYGKDI